MAGKTNITRSSVHAMIYFASLCLFVISLPSSRYFITISLLMLSANWLAEGNLREKLRIFFRDRAAVAFSLIYILYVAGLLWSSDLSYALHNDLLHKLPTFFMPLIIVTSPRPDLKKARLLLLLFISSVFVVSVIGILIRLFSPGSTFRDASPYMPGIYFGMMLIMAAFQLPILVREYSSDRRLLIVGFVLSAWLIFFLFYLRTLSGIASFAGVLLLMLVLVVKKVRSIPLKGITIMLFILMAVLFLWPAINIYRQTHLEIETDFSLPDMLTEYGNHYTHDTLNPLRENGYPVYLFISEKELEDAWSKRSEFDFYGNDLSGHELRYTLYRFMASKGLRKDGEGLMALNDREIDEVEKGTTNYLNIGRPGFYIRLYEEFTGLYLYQKTSYQEASWSSVTQRADQFRASLRAFRRHPLIGWGTGSILQAMDYGFEKNNSELQGLNMKPHNQYIYLLLTLGVAGLLAFLVLYTCFVLWSGVYRNLMFKIFIIVFAINFLANNSIESQLGQNLFVFFSLFYGFLYPGMEREEV